MGGYADWRAADYGFIFYHDFHGLRQNVQSLDVRRYCADSAVYIRVWAYKQCGENFIRSYAGVCLQGVVIALSCIILSAISSSPPAVDTSASVVTAVWTYVGELAFNLLVLVGAIKGCDRIVKEIMGLWVAGAAFLWYNRATKGVETMPEIIPIRDLKNTNAISQRCHETAEPIFVTKNGYGDMVIMSMEAYEHQQIMNDVYAKLATAEAQHEAGMGRSLADILKETSKKYEL